MGICVCDLLGLGLVVQIGYCGLLLFCSCKNWCLKQFRLSVVLIHLILGLLLKNSLLVMFYFLSLWSWIHDVVEKDVLNGFVCNLWPVFCCFLCNHLWKAVTNWNALLFLSRRRRYFTTCQEIKLEEDLNPSHFLVWASNKSISLLHKFQAHDAWLTLIEVGCQKMKTLCWSFCG